MLLQYDPGVPVPGRFPSPRSTGIVAHNNILIVLRSLTQGLLLGNPIQERNKAQECMSCVACGARCPLVSIPGWGVGVGRDGQVSRGRHRWWTPIHRRGIRRIELDVGLVTHLDLKSMMPSGKETEVYSTMLFM